MSGTLQLRNSTDHHVIDPARFISTHMTTGSSIDMNIDGSSTSVLFKYICPANTESAIARLNIHIQDGKVDPPDFGGISALTNGVLFEIYDSDDTLIIDLLDGVPIKANTHWAMFAGTDVVVHTGTGDDAMTARWTFARAGGALHITAGQYFQATIRDNLSAISAFHMVLQGVNVPV